MKDIKIMSKPTNTEKYIQGLDDKIYRQQRIFNAVRAYIDSKRHKSNRNKQKLKKTEK